MPMNIQINNINKEIINSVIIHIMFRIRVFKFTIESKCHINQQFNFPVNCFIFVTGTIK